MRELIEAIQKISKTYGVGFVKIYDAVVVSVDRDKRTCIVNSVGNDVQIKEVTVRLMSDIADGDYNIPTVGTNIIVATSDFLQPIMIGFTWLDEKEIVIGDQALTIKNGSQVFNDGAYGGIPRVINPDSDNDSLLARLKDHEEKYNDLKDQFNTFKSDFDNFISTVFNLHTHVCAAPSSPSAVPVPTGNGTTAQNGKVLSDTTQEQIENPNIKHGKQI